MYQPVHNNENNISEESAGEVCQSPSLTKQLDQCKQEAVGAGGGQDLTTLFCWGWGGGGELGGSS